ncbi:hypothetical protein VKS41_003903 [Umbelopsis sp. WA50703]
MGMTCIVRWKNATGMRDFTTIDEHVVKTLHGKNTGRWGLTCKVYRDNSRNNSGKLLYQISLAQQPRQLYCMVDGGVVVEVERDVETIFSRLKNLWVIRQSATIEGTSYDIGDFTLRVANILLGSTYKGLLLEVEYRPCSSPYGATEIIRDFVESLIPANAQLSIDTEYDYEKVGLSNQEFTIAHTGYQYMHLFRKDSLL